MLWSSRFALKRAVKDQLTKILDPDVCQKFARMERKARKEYGQQSWWHRGDALPERAPDLGAVTGQ